MKKLAVLILVVLLGGCAPALSNIPRQTEIIGFDFSKYSEKGFLITPGEYGENYEAIGLITFSIYPEATKILSGKTARDSEEIYWKIGKIAPEEVIELAYQEAIHRKADAITHFSISFDTKTYFDGLVAVKITGVKVSGLLIKRK